MSFFSHDDELLIKRTSSICKITWEIHLCNKWWATMDILRKKVNFWWVWDLEKNSYVPRSLRRLVHCCKICSFCKNSLLGGIIVCLLKSLLCENLRVQFYHDGQPLHRNQWPRITFWYQSEIFSSTLIGGLGGTICVQVQLWMYQSLQKDLCTFQFRIRIARCTLCTYMLKFKKNNNNIMNLLTCASHT